VLRSILIGLDGSSYSQSALELGIEWARRFDATIAGLGIVDKPAIFQPEPEPIGASTYKQDADEARFARATHQVQQFLEQFSLRCAAAGVSSKVLEDVGEPYEQIVLEAQRYDLIILGKQTYFHFATQEGPCETLKKVLKNSPRPVVRVPEKLEAGETIMVAHDGSLQAARVLQAFQAIGLADGRDVHVVTVGKDHVEAFCHADRAAEFLASHGIKTTTHAIVASAAVAKLLLDQLSRLGVGLVVMGVYGQPVLKEFFLGSVTRTFLKESPVPLFLYH
jgi:nucleotide-binding universal stress UspA family protein